MRFPRLQRVPGLAAIGLAALCGCQPAPPIKVAFIGGLSGRISELAIDGRNGAELAIEALNAQAGPRYELRVHDDGSVAEQAPAVVDSVADEGDAFAVGPMTSMRAKAMVPEASNRHLVLISPTANSDELSGSEDYFFRVIPSAGPGAEQLAGVAIARGWTTASVMMEWRNRSYTESFTKRFSERFKGLGGASPNLVSYESGENPDFGKIAAALLSTHPKIVLLVCSAVDAAIVAQQLRRLDPDVQLAMSSWAASVQLLQLAGRAIDGALVMQALDLDNRAPAYVDFRKRFMERFGNPPGSGAVFSYDATMMGAEGLRRRKGDQSLRDALRTPGTAWPGLQQPLVLDRFGDSVGRLHLSEVRNGRFVMLPS
jgi:branched-chain amino acid transport system substrate-binding protein